MNLASFFFIETHFNPLGLGPRSPSFSLASSPHYISDPTPGAFTQINLG